MFDQLKVVATVISGENRGEKVFYGQIRTGLFVAVAMFRCL